MRIAVLQPSYLPWLGYLDQIVRSDAFVFYDDVQYDKNGWRNRNRIRISGGDGWAWLTIPVRLAASFQPLLEVESDARAPWRRKHRNSIQGAYSHAPHFDLFERCFSTLFSGSETRLVEIAIASIQAFVDVLGINTPMYRSSQLNMPGKRNERLLSICRHFGATHYLSGSAARSYLDLAAFAESGITVEWQDYNHPVYPQQYVPFISHLSALDALLNVGTGVCELLGRPDSPASSTNVPRIPL